MLFRSLAVQCRKDGRSHLGSQQRHICSVVIKKVCDAAHSIEEKLFIVIQISFLYCLTELRHELVEQLVLELLELLGGFLLLS